MGKKPKFYGVRRGRKTGVFNSWEECKESIHGYPSAVYKSFASYQEALDWYQGKVETPLGSLFEENAKDSQGDAQADFEVYTDGSYRDGQYSWAYAFVKDGKIIYEDSNTGKNPAAASMRNVAGEIAAVLYAVKRAAELGVKIRIYHDYVGIAHWATGEWKARNKFTQFYAQKMKEYRGIYSFRKVKSHSGNHFNDYVDQKAKDALDIRTEDKMANLDILQSSNVWKYIGIQITSNEDGKKGVWLKNSENLKQLHGSIHGGIIATCIDAALAVAVNEAIGEEKNAVTVELKVNYLLPVVDSDLWAYADLVKVGKRLLTGTVEVFDHEKNIVAIGSGTFALINR